METTTKQVNWAHDFAICESLHLSAQSIGGVYRRIVYKNPNDKNVQFWKDEISKWFDYDSKIKDLFFATEDEGNVEVEKLYKICKSANELEDSLALPKA